MYIKCFIYHICTHHISMTDPIGNLLYLTFLFAPFSLPLGGIEKKKKVICIQKLFLCRVQIMWFRVIHLLLYQFFLFVSIGIIDITLHMEISQTKKMYHWVIAKLGAFALMALKEGGATAPFRNCLMYFFALLINRNACNCPFLYTWIFKLPHGQILRLGDCHT